MMKNNNRRGIILVSAVMVDQEPNIVAMCFNNISFVPLKIQQCFATDTYKYMGRSPEFSEVEEGAMFPEYIIEISEVDGGGKKFEVMKK